MDINYKLLGKRIKEMRTKQNLTQENLAEQVGVSTVYISHIEIGSSKPSIETLVKICNVLNVSFDYLLSNFLYASKEYLQDDIANLLKNCSSDDMKLIIDMIKVIIEHKQH